MGSDTQEILLLETSSVATSALGQLQTTPSLSEENGALLEQANSHRSRGEVDLAFALFRMVAQTTGRVEFWEEALSCQPKDREFFEELISNFPSQTSPILTLGYLYLGDPSFLARAKEAAPTDPLPLWAALIAPPPEEQLLLTAHTLSERFPSLPFWPELTSSLMREVERTNHALKERVVRLEEELEGLRSWVNQIAGDLARVKRTPQIPAGGVSRSRQFTTSSIGSAYPPGARVNQFDHNLWNHTLGGVVDAPLSSRFVETLLAAPCPFFSGRQVGETQRLLLIPPRVNKLPLDLFVLHDLFLRAKCVLKIWAGRGVNLSANREVESDFVKLIQGEARSYPYWMLTTNEAIAVVESLPLLYRPLNSLEVVISALTEYVSSGHRAYPRGVYVRTCHRRALAVGEKSREMNVYIGDFREGVLNVRYIKSKRQMASSIALGRDVELAQPSSSSHGENILTLLEEELLL